MPKLHWRWAKDMDDKPAEGEAVVRLHPIPGSRSVERYPGLAVPTPALRLDPTTGELAATELRSTNLVLVRHRMEMTVTAGDGRELRAHFESDATAPQTDSDADTDLLDVMNGAWRRRKQIGRPRRIMNIENDEQVLRAVILTRDQAGVRLTALNVGTWSETFTYSNLRSYLRLTNRTWRELLHTLLASEMPSTPRSSGRGPVSTSPRKS